MTLRHLASLTLALLAGATAALAAPLPDDFTLDLGGVRFDPRQQEPAALLPATWRSDAARLAERDTFLLVQLHGKTFPADLARVQNAGFEVVQYIHPFTYIVWGQPSRLSSLAAGARWSGVFEPAYKVQPRFRALAAAEIEADILAWAPTADATRAALLGLGVKVDAEAAIDHRFVHFNARLSGARFSEVAQIPGVYVMKPEPKDGGDRGEITDMVNFNQSGPGYLAYLSTLGVNGDGVIMANVDSGVQDTHPDLVNRMLPCTGSTCGGANQSSHGTHTAGIMAADGSSGTLSNGYLRGLGVAPGAKLVEQRYTGTFTQPNGMRIIMEQSSENNAVLSGNSWGPAGSPQGYDDDTMQVDLSVRDADDDVAGNQAFSYVLSFMNGNGGTSTQGTPDEAKNVFSVGSTRGQSTSTAPDAALNNISANSGHGPALDGRKIPHIVAPGCSVDSTVPTNSYSLQCGTSMASPHVAGAVGLFFEYYRDLFAANPSPALVKAAFLPVARDLFGNQDADGGTLGHRFDSKQGWGRMDLQAVLDPATSVAYFDNPTTFQSTGATWTQAVTVDDNTQPVKIMLVWTDAAGHGLGGSTPAWNNDLDLVVTAGADTYLGNVFAASGWSATGGTADNRNNTEGVLIAAGVSGQITLTVEAANLTSNGVPGEGSGTDQDFALVCYNCIGDAAVPLFEDGFESGNTGGWTSASP